MQMAYGRVHVASALELSATPMRAGPSTTPDKLAVDIGRSETGPTFAFGPW